jgi:hypothetical protein
MRMRPGRCRRCPGQRARQDLNLRPIAPEAIALSPELRARRSERLPVVKGERVFVRRRRYLRYVRTIHREFDRWLQDLFERLD